VETRCNGSVPGWNRTRNRPGNLDPLLTLGAGDSRSWDDTVCGVCSTRCTLYLVLATGPGNPPAVRVWTAKTGWFGSRTDQKPNLLTLGGPNPDPYPSTLRFRRVLLDQSVAISGSAFRVSYLWSHSDMLLLIVKY